MKQHEASANCRLIAPFKLTTTQVSMVHMMKKQLSLQHGSKSPGSYFHRRAKVSYQGKLSTTVRLVKTKQEWRNWRQDATVASCWVPLRHAGPAVRCVPLNVHDPNLIPGQQSLAKNAPDPFDRCMIDFDFALLPQAMSICLAMSVKYLRLMYYIPRIWENPIWKTAFRNTMYLAD